MFVNEQCGCECYLVLNKLEKYDILRSQIEGHIEQIRKKYYRARSILELGDLSKIDEMETLTEFYFTLCGLIGKEDRI